MPLVVSSKTDGPALWLTMMNRTGNREQEFFATLNKNLDKLGPAGSSSRAAIIHAPDVALVLSEGPNSFFKCTFKAGSTCTR